MTSRRHTPTTLLPHASNDLDTSWRSVESDLIETSHSSYYEESPMKVTMAYPPARVTASKLLEQMDPPFRRNAEPSRSKRTQTMLALLGVTILLGLPLGLVLYVRSSSSSIDNRANDPVQDEFMLNQERLLIDLARTHDTASQHDDLLHHMDMLRQELIRKTFLLDQEVTRRTDAEREVKECWATYEVKTGLTSGLEHQRSEDLERLYRTLATKSFGSGPHYVQFELEDVDGDVSEHAFFTVELASLDAMPVTVFTFLQQVDSRLWDDSSFHLNTQHALFTQPVSASTGVSRLVDMGQAGLAHVPLKESSSDLPHVEYTMGLKDDPRTGVQLFINKVDNSINHQGEPYLGKILIGKGAVDKLGLVQNASGDPFIKPVGIASVRLLTDLAQAVGGQAYLEALAEEDKAL